MALLRKCLLLYGYVLQVHLSTGRDMERKKERTHRVVTFHNSIPTFIRPYPSWRSGEILPHTMCKGMLCWMTLRVSGRTLLLLLLLRPVHQWWTHFSTTIWCLVCFSLIQTPAYTNGSSAHTSENKYKNVQQRVPERVKETASRKHGSSSSNKQCEIGNKD